MQHATRTLPALLALLLPMACNPPSDGDGTTGSLTDAGSTVACDNALPVIAAVSLSPDDPSCADTLICTATGVDDADGDTVAVSYTWWIDDVEISESSDSLIGGWSPGQRVRCAVTPDDGTDSGSQVSSNEVTAVNTAPGAPVVEVSPTSPIERADPLLCSVVEQPEDCDGDKLEITLGWTLDGASWTGDTTSSVLTNDMIAAADTVEAQEWTCTAVASDGSAQSDPASDSVVIGDGFDFFPSDSDVMSSDADWCFLGAEYDYLGWSVGRAPDIDADGLADFAMGAEYADSDGMENNGAVYLFRAADLGEADTAMTTVDLADAWITFRGAADGDRLGHEVKTIGDMDGDGVGELLLTAELGDGGNGAVYIFMGSSLALRTGDVSVADADITLLDNLSYSAAGFGMGVTSGDFDGDGIADLAIGAPYLYYSTIDAGYVFIFQGTDIVSGGTFQSTDADSWTTYGDENYGYLGFSMTALDDIDGDGKDDLAVGAYLADTSGNDGGKVYVLLSTGGLQVDSSWYGYQLITDVADLVISGDFGGVRTGHDLAQAGDWDGDGLTELIVGSVGYDDGGGAWTGRSYLFTADQLTNSTTTALIGSDAAITFDASSDVGYLGLDNWGDFDADGDGMTDLLLGAPKAGTGGEVYLFAGSDLATGTISVDLASATFAADAANEGNGKSVLSPGDVNGDGYDDVLIGAYTDNTAGTSAGRVCLYLTP